MKKGNRKVAKTLNIAIAGLGTVGAVVAARLLAPDSATHNTGLKLIAVNARDKTRDRGVDLSAIEWVDNPCDLADMAQVDVVIELIGGTDGVAYELVKRALKNGKHVVTANKAMMANHGFELAQLAEASGVYLGYEAAVAGGIPVIKALREGLAANKVRRVSGILNGTCNYILSEMTQKGVDFAPTLKQAQELGYAEADPEFDIEGIDAAQKLTLLTSLSFGTKPDIAGVDVTGITNITSRDIDYAGGFGFVIRLVGVCEQVAEDDNSILQWVGPCLIKKNQPLAMIENVTNAVQIEADMVGQIILQGPGAGGDATASAVLADVHDVRLYDKARVLLPVFGQPTNTLKAIKKNAPLAPCPWYLRLMLVDAAGSMAQVTSVLAEHGVSIEEIVQRSPENDAINKDAGRPVIFITHNVQLDVLETALNKLRSLDVIDADMNYLPVFSG